MPKPESCSKERENLFELIKQINITDDQLSIFDLLPAKKRKLEQELARLKGQRPGLERKLKECKAAHGTGER
jgi:hypothetical protein